MRVSDYIFKRLKEKYGVDRVFMITGGGAMHLNDAVLQSGLAYTCCHHEQACAIAAEGYVRAGKRLGVVNVTTGPGGLNTLTGVMDRPRFPHVPICRCASWVTRRWILFRW